MSDEKSKEDEAPAADEEAEEIPATATTEDAETTLKLKSVTPQPPARRNAPNSRKRGRGGRTTAAVREGYGDIGSPAKNGKTSDSPKENSRDGAGSGADSSTGQNGNGNGMHQPNIIDRPSNGTRRGRPGRDRHEGPREPTMAELKRRAAAMLEFISRSQKEMADAEVRGLRSPRVVVHKASPLADGSNANDSPPEDKSANHGNDANGSDGKEAAVNGTTGAEPPATPAGTATGGAASMADDLATRLVKWQQTFTGEGAVSVDS